MTASVPSTTVLGTWTGTVTHDDEVDDYTVTLDPDGSVAMSTNRSKGVGTWATTGPDTFVLSLKETFDAKVDQHSPNGFAAAYLKIDLVVHLDDARTFSGSGDAVVHGPSDEVIYSTRAVTTANRAD